MACLAGCGRFGFGTSADDVGGDDARDAAPDGFVPTGPVGPRWVVAFTNDNSSSVVGRNGEVQILSRFVTTFQVDQGVSLTGNGFISTAFLRFDAAGALTSSTVLDSDGFCDMRSAVLDGDATYLAGFTQGVTSMPAYGACSIVTNRQDPIAIKIDQQGNQSLVAHWIAAGGNAQGWNVEVMPDHTLTIDGIYSVSLQIGPYTMPTGITDPSVFVARTTSDVNTATWAKGFTAGVAIYPGPIASSGDDICIIGSHAGNVSVFGRALPYVGGEDSWIARVDGGGTERFVRAIGSTGNEASYGGGAIIHALSDGGCLASIVAQGDVALDTGMSLLADGAGLVVQLAADGKVTWARRFPSQPYIANVSGRWIAAYTTTNDVAVVEIDVQGGADVPLGVIEGAGVQDAVDIAAVGPDAVAVTVNTRGVLTFGATSFDSGATTLRAVAVLGI